MKKYISLGLLIAWMGVIYFFSSQNGVASGNLSSGLLSEIGILLHIEDLNGFVLKYGGFIRKLAHFTEYFILGVLMLNVLKQYTNKEVLVVAIILCAIYATSDELHQLLIDGRCFAILDILIDTCGSVIGAFLTNLIFKKCCQEKKL